MRNPGAIISGFVLDHLAEQPLARRITLTRALAELAPTNHERRQLIAMADDLETVERRHQQLLFNFRGGKK